MYLRKITTRNLQNHKEVVIDLPPTGLVVFTGPNSNGKSVIERALLDLLSGGLHRPRTRAALVNHNATYAELEFVRSDDVVLLTRISRQANLTYVTYTEPGKEPITRYLADRSYKDLVSRFGWHYDKDVGISLNAAQAEEALLFYKTPFKANGSVLRTATSDTLADKAAESIEATLKETRAFRESCIQQITTIQGALSGLKTEPIEPLQDRKIKLERYLRNLQYIYFPELPEIRPVPKVSFVNIYYPKIPEIRPVPEVKVAKVYYPKLPIIKYPRILRLSINLPDIVPIAKDLEALRQHRCPTCGRGFDCDC